MRLRLLPSVLIFLSSYFPLAIIFIIKDLDDVTYFPQHPWTAATIALVTLLACVVVIATAGAVKSGVPVMILKVANKSGDMFTYTIPYMISFYNFNLGDWKTLLSLFVFMALMFALAYKTQNMFINPVLALAGYGLYDCQFKDGTKELQGLIISKSILQVGDTCLVERLSYFLYFATSVVDKEKKNDAGQMVNSI